MALGSSKTRPRNATRRSVCKKKRTCQRRASNSWNTSLHMPVFKCGCEYRMHNRSTHALCRHLCGCFKHRVRSTCIACICVYVHHYINMRARLYAFICLTVKRRANPWRHITAKGNHDNKVKHSNARHTKPIHTADAHAKQSVAKPDKPFSVKQVKALEQPH